MSEPGIVKKAPPDNPITPDEVVSMLVGANSVKLSGFGGQPLECPFWLPNLETYDPKLAQLAVGKCRKIVRWLLLGSSALTIASLGGLLFWLGTFLNDGISGQTLSWMPKAVIQDGVVMMIGSTLVTVPTGTMLPSGEILRSVNAARQTYATDNNETAVKR